MLNLLASRGPDIARWVLILLIAAMLANTVLFFVAPPTTEVSGEKGPSTAQRPDATTSTASVDIESVVQKHLFGVAPVESEPDEEPAEQLAETRLPLELNGVFVSEEDPKLSAAIIAQRGRAGELYTIGKKVPGNAELLEVHRTFVVLRRAGVRETLRFPELKTRFDETPVPAGPAATASRRSAGTPAQPAEPPRTAREFVERYRDRLEDDPTTTLNELGVQPVAVGEARGYKLGAVAAPQLSQSGLQPGDVVLSVNGLPVGNVQQDQGQIDSILAQGSARIEVQRGSRRFFVTASLKDQK